MTPGPGPRRIPALDIARTAAIAGMVVFHFTYDLALFGFVRPDLVHTPFWANFARLVAGSFLFLAGVGLWLAHGRGIRWPSFLRRLAIIGAAAALVTGATWVAMPDRFIFFGILHSIAVASLIGLAVLRLPIPLIAALGAGVLALPHLVRHEVFSAPALLWTGLAPVPPTTLDYEPVFPWLAPCLFGIAAAKWLDLTGHLHRHARPATPRLARLAWPGRHSLAIYLIHQPVLIGLLGALRWILP